MAKKFLAVAALLLASVFTFVACSGDNYAFDALSDNPAATDTVKSNGGIYVEKGKYSYFVNGAQSSSASNEFGVHHKGSIVRCLTSDLTKADRNVEVVVPKVIYAGDLDSSGFYIYGDKIYYTTANNVKDANGNVQYNKLDFMSVNLDGTGTQLIATIDDNLNPFNIVEKNGEVYILYYTDVTKTVNGEETTVKAIKQINAQTKEQKLVADDVSSYAFDRSEGGVKVAFTKTIRKKVVATGQETEENYNELYVYSAGDEEASLVVSGKVEDSAKRTKYTVQTMSGGYVYYTYQTTMTADKALAKASSSQDIVKLVDSEYSSFIPFNENGKDGIYVVENGWFKKITFANGEKEPEVLLAKSDVSSGATINLEKVYGGYLYFTVQEEENVTTGILYRIKTDEENQEKAYTVVSGSMASTWTNFDFTTVNGEVAVVYFNESESLKFLNYTYMDIFAFDAEGEEDIKSKRIGRLTENDSKSAVENGDDKNAVDAADKFI